MNDLNTKIHMLLSKTKDLFTYSSYPPKNIWMQYIILRISALYMVSDNRDLEEKGNMIMKEICDFLNASFVSLEITKNGYGILPKVLYWKKQTSNNPKYNSKARGRVDFFKDIIFDNKTVGRISIRDCSNKRVRYLMDDSSNILFKSLTQLVLRLLDNEKLYYLAYYDQLTMLPNRIHFMEKISDAILASREVNEITAVLFFDLDAFKEINDTFGHDRGDELLKNVASRLCCSNKQYCIASRYGGDEYLILLQHLTDKEQIHQAAASLLKVIEEPFIVSEERINITASIGISIFPDHGNSAEELLIKADQAMYTAKSNGKGQYAFFHTSSENNITT